MTTDTATKVLGARIRRREDPIVISGTVIYTDDLNLPGMAYMTLLRSPYGHARSKSIDTSAAKQVEGVVMVLTGKDIEGKVGNLPTAWLLPDTKVPAHPTLAIDTVTFTGDPVALVVAESRGAARDALDKIDVEYEPLPVVVDMEAALAEGAPQLHANAPNNVAFTWSTGGGDADAALASAEVRISQRLINNRLIPTPIEPRAVVAQYNPGLDEMTVWSTTQVPYFLRLFIAALNGLHEARVRVIAPEVGGGFGAKLNVYAEEILVPYLAKTLGRPIKWTETRSENYVGTIHGRDHITDVEIGATKDGVVKAVKVKTLANMGAYLMLDAPAIPTILYALILPGPYKIQNYHADVTGVLTNTAPTDAYRGAGRPEATYVIERVMNLVARETGLDPAEVRRRNFVPAEEFPYTSVVGLSYDSGNYAPAIERALQIVGYDDLRQEQKKLRDMGSKRLIGIGLSSYVEICGLAPSSVAGATGFGGGAYESSTVRFHPTGKVLVITGSSAHGQGHDTTFAQMVSDELGVPYEDIEIVHGDTGRAPFGVGTFGSRSAAVGAVSVYHSVQKIKEKAKKIAAHLLEANESDIVYENGKLYVAGSPDRGKTIGEIAGAAWTAHNMPEGVEPVLDVTTYHDPKNFVYPFGTHIAVVEVDTETGAVNLSRYVAVDDCGNVINPMIVDGQVHGGVVQGVAQALWEEAVYDENGQLLSGTLMDYALPRADGLPMIETARTVTPSPTNPLGVKGIGEAGTIASTAAVANAVIDALDVKHLDMPYKAEKVWAALNK
jgi:carbon-monoxide dehydrogenase large subunit